MTRKLFSQNKGWIPGYISTQPFKFKAQCNFSQYNFFKPLICLYKVDNLQL